MAKGDTQHSKRRRRQSWSNSTWDQYYRQESRKKYEWVEKNGVDALFDADVEEFLEILDATNRIDRYGSKDWERIRGKVESSGNHTIRQLEEKIVKSKEILRERQMEADKLNKLKEAQRLENFETRVYSDLHWAEIQAGQLQSNLYDSVYLLEEYGLRSGDFLDNPVEAIIGEGGFAEETYASGGIKLQVTISIDTSNSMIANMINQVASIALVKIYNALKFIKESYPDDFYYQGFYFSGGEFGKAAGILRQQYYGTSGEVNMGDVNDFYEYPFSQFKGEDTWFYPLFEEIAKWESENGNPDAHRLDLIISDAVFQHPTDITKINDIQEMRDGSLQTVIINLLDRREWTDVNLPNRTVMYDAQPDMLDSMLDSILEEFLQIALKF